MVLTGQITQIRQKYRQNALNDSFNEMEHNTSISLRVQKIKQSLNLSQIEHSLSNLKCPPGEATEKTTTPDKNHEPGGENKQKMKSRQKASKLTPHKRQNSFLDRWNETNRNMEANNEFRRNKLNQLSEQQERSLQRLSNLI